MGIPPQLAGRAEVVWRHTGEHDRLAVGVETEQLSLCPDVRAVVRDEDRQIAHDLDRSRAAGIAHALPLIEEQKLRQFVQPDLSSAMGRPARNRRWIALRDVGLPCRPGDVPLRLLDGHEQREVVQPTRLRVAEAVETIAHRHATRRFEAVEHSRPERPTVGDDSREVNVPWLEEVPVTGLRLGEQAVLDQPFETDQQGIACERGKALVWGVTVASRSERQHLPQSLAGGREQIDELESAGAEIADAEAARQRCRMEKHAA